ncbi:MAG: choice-of-anchor V domain-containing protein [Saprospiraceae bacterium]
MKLRFIYTFLGLLLFAFLFMSNAGGRPGNYANAPGDTGFCDDCHSSTGAGNIMLTGAPSSYIGGQTYNMTITLTDAAAAVGGFQIVATNGVNNSLVGSFTPGTGQTLNNVNRLVQSGPKAFSGGSVSWPVSWTAPSSSPPANVQFYFAGNAANGNGNSGSGDNAYAGVTGIIPLPVELSYFEVKPMENEIVKLNWQTQSEENSDYFEIQRSQNESEFENIGRIFSAGNSTEVNDYEFEDKLPLLNQFSYYRLKQVDLDGKITFSNVKSVKMEREGKLNVFPNPIKSNQTLNISYPNSNNLEKRVHIVNTMGGVVFQSILNNQNADDSYIFDLPKLPIGIYFVSIFENQNLVEVEKLLIQ